jgi:hypothetical protein
MGCLSTFWGLFIIVYYESIKREPKIRVICSWNKKRFINCSFFLKNEQTSLLWMDEIEEKERLR